MRTKEKEVGVIYSITNLVNDKKYIGSTHRYKKRICIHRSELRRGKHFNTHLQAAFNQYGEMAFDLGRIIEVLPDGYDDLELIAREKYWIFELKTLDSKFGYNKNANPYQPPAKGKPFKNQQYYLDKFIMLAISNEWKIIDVSTLGDNCTAICPKGHCVSPVPHDLIQSWHDGYLTRGCSVCKNYFMIEQCNKYRQYTIDYATKKYKDFLKLHNWTLKAYNGCRKQSDFVCSAGHHLSAYAHGIYKSLKNGGLACSACYDILTANSDAKNRFVIDAEKNGWKIIHYKAMRQLVEAVCPNEHVCMVLPSNLKRSWKNGKIGCFRCRSKEIL